MIRNSSKCSNSPSHQENPKTPPSLHVNLTNLARWAPYNIIPDFFDFPDFLDRGALFPISYPIYLKTIREPPIFFRFRLGESERFRATFTNKRAIIINGSFVDKEARVKLYGIVGISRALCSHGILFVFFSFRHRESFFLLQHHAWLEAVMIFGNINDLVDMA